MNFLQSSFKLSREKGVRLEIVDEEAYFCCPECGRNHPHLWVVWRKVRQMYGFWPVFRLNGQDRLVDVSVPVSVREIGGLPRDAVKLPPGEAGRAWHA